MATRNGNGQFVKPPLGTLEERSGPQSHTKGRSIIPHIPPYLETAAAIGGFVWPNTNTPDVTLNPMGFPGYGTMYTGTYETYSWMLQHPIHRLVRAICVAIIAANTWEYEKVGKNSSQEAVDFTKETFDRLRYDLIWDFYVRGRDYGWAGGEPVWIAEDGGLKLERVKPLAQRASEILEDNHGNFVGIRNHVSVDDRSQTKPVEIAAPYKAWKYTYDSETGYGYGRSWLENSRATAWKMWLDCAQQLQMLGSKISGTIGIIFSPAGTFPGPIDPATGKPTMVSYEQNAKKVIEAFKNGSAGAWFPSLSLMPDAKGNIDAMKVLVELAGKSLTHFEKFDFTGQTAAIKPILERMIHAEELMFAAGMLSARVGMEGKHGTKAEAGEHTDTATINAEAEDEGFAKACQPLVDANLVLNMSPKLAGKVRIKPPSLVDRKTSIYKATLLAMLNDTTISKQLALTPGLMTSLLRVLDITSDVPFDDKALAKSVEEDRKAKEPKPGPAATGNKQPEPQGGRPPQG